MEVQTILTKRYTPATAQQRVEVEEKIKKMRKEGEQLVKGMFEFVDAQGGWFDFDYRFFPGEPIVRIKIIHGEIVDVPRIVAKHLNNVYKKVRVPSPQRDESGNPVKGGTLTKISRTRFTPVDIM